jgi:hypothetical protein
MITLSNIAWLVVITGISLFCFAVVPLSGAVFKRHTWHTFRQRFNDLQAAPLLDYNALRQGQGKQFRFCGGFESITEDNILWVQNENLTIPVSLKNAKTFMLPATDETFNESNLDNSTPLIENIRWNKLSLLTAGSTVFIGGLLEDRGGRKTFVSDKKHPLIIIFYECSPQNLAFSVMCSGRIKSEYFNPITPYALIVGIFSMIYIAQNFYMRPAYRLTVLGAVIAMFSPLFPALPPGLVFTILQKRVRLHASFIKIRRDIDLSKTNERCKPHTAAYCHATFKAVLFESLAWFLQISGIVLNVFFAVLIAFSLQ